MQSYWPMASLNRAEWHADGTGSKSNGWKGKSLHAFYPYGGSGRRPGIPLVGSDIHFGAFLTWTINRHYNMPCSYARNNWLRKAIPLNLNENLLADDAVVHLFVCPRPFVCGLSADVNGATDIRPRGPRRLGGDGLQSGWLMPNNPKLSRFNDNCG